MDEVEKMQRKLKELGDAIMDDDYERVNILLKDLEYHEEEDGIGVLRLKEK